MPRSHRPRSCIKRILVEETRDVLQVKGKGAQGRVIPIKLLLAKDICAWRSTLKRRFRASNHFQVIKSTPPQRQGGGRQDNRKEKDILSGTEEG